MDLHHRHYKIRLRKRNIQGYEDSVRFCLALLGVSGEKLVSTLVVLILLHPGILFSQIEFLGLEISVIVNREEVPGVHVPPFFVFSDFWSGFGRVSLASRFDRRVVR